jgi:hypothetical protein
MVLQHLFQTCDDIRAFESLAAVEKIEQKIARFADG